MKKRPEKPENHERWLLTYSDLITLLMIFFVILYASSNIDTKKYKQISDSFKVGFGGGKQIVDTSDGTTDGIINSGVSTNEDNKTKDAAILEQAKLDKAQVEIDKLIADSGLKDSITTSTEERGLVISFKDNIFFDSGKADIKSDMKGKLDSIAKILNKIDSYIRIEGHTDNLPIKTKEFNSNWQLSSMRAANVVDYMVTAGMAPERLSAVGYGEYRPIVENNNKAAMSKNRRVDIVILNSKFNGSENKK